MVILCSTGQKEAKECIQVKYLIYAVCRNFKFVVIYAFFPAKCAFTKFQSSQKLFFFRSDNTFMMTLDIAKKIKFSLYLHIKAYHLNHWMLSLYAFKYPHCSVTLLSQGWNYFCYVYSHLDLIHKMATLETFRAKSSENPFFAYFW